MNALITILVSLSGILGPGDTLRSDGYYLKVTDQASSWHMLYFRADGSFMDSTSRGTPPAFEKEHLLTSRFRYTFSSTKNSQVVTLSPGALSTDIGAQGALDFEYLVDRGDLVFTGWLDHRKNKWQKMKERYFFVPF